MNVGAQIAVRNQMGYSVEKGKLSETLCHGRK